MRTSILHRMTVRNKKKRSGGNKVECLPTADPNSRNEPGSSGVERKTRQKKGGNKG